MVRRAAVLRNKGLGRITLRTPLNPGIAGRVATLGIIAVMSASCATDPGRMTGIGAVTGGAIGAGLGALVGAQAGDPTTGLLLGGAAGSVAGGVVANQFEAEDRYQDEAQALARQQGLQISRQRREIATLRSQGLSDDSPTATDTYPTSRVTQRDYRIPPSSQRGFKPVDQEDMRAIYVERRNNFAGRSGEMGSEGRTERAEHKDVPTSELEKASQGALSSLRPSAQAPAGAAAPTPRRPSQVVADKAQAVDRGARTSPSESSQRSDQGGPLPKPSLEKKVLQQNARQENPEKTRVLAKPPKVQQENAGISEIKIASTLKGDSRLSESKVAKKAELAHIESKPRDSRIRESARGDSPKVSVPVRKAPGLEASREVNRVAPREDVTTASDRTAPVARSNGLQSTGTSKPMGEDSAVSLEKPSGVQEVGGKAAPGECAQAAQEMEKSNQTSESSEKLFHYRRALRLCPSDARYHIKLGDHYRSLKRLADANFEYKEALALDPANGEAKQRMEDLKNG